MTMIDSYFEDVPSHHPHIDCPGTTFHPQCVMESQIGKRIEHVIEDPRLWMALLVVVAVLFLFSWEIELVGFGLFSEPFDKEEDEEAKTGRKARPAPDPKAISPTTT